MGVVWRGVHKEQGVPVAVKVSTSARALVARYQEDFRREVQAVARLEHPHIITPYDYGLLPAGVEEASQGQLIANSPYLVMEYAGGGSLDALRGVLEWQRLRQVLLIVLNGLSHAHARGVIHRDIKPANVLLPGVDDVRPTIKLTDFGLAHPYDRQAPTRPDVPLDSLRENISGTPHYMAPEQIEGRWRDYGPWTDLYAMGIMAFELASGRLPFVANSFRELAVKHGLEEIPEIEALTWLPAGFQTWLRKLTAKDPAMRYQRASAAAWALQQLPDSEESEQLSRVQVAGVEVRSRPLEARYRHDLAPCPRSWRESLAQTRPMKLIGAGLGLYGLRDVQLVSREEERDRLWAAFGRVRAEGGARAVFLSGPSGCGKSKLASWLCHLAHEAGGATVLKAKHGPSPDAAHGLPRMMASYYRCVGLSARQMAPRVRRDLHAAGVADPYEWQALTSFMCADGSDVASEFEYVHFKSPVQRFALLERALQRMSAARPLIVWLDDVHWGSEAMEFCRYVLEQSASDGQAQAKLSVLFVLTARDDAAVDSAELRALMEHPLVEPFEVQPLAREDMTRLVERLLGLSGELAANIAARVGGSPIFAVELVGDWVQRGVLRVGQQGFVLKSGELALIPDDLHSIWQSRLRDILRDYPADAELALEAVALLGDEVVATEAAALCARLGVRFPETLLERLVTRRLAVLTEAGWSMAHAALLESLERIARERGRFAEIHRACAAVISEQYAPGKRGLASRLAWHWMQAEAHEEALQPLLDAAHESRVTCQFEQAHTYLRYYEESLSKLGVGEDGEDRRRVQMWIEKVILHSRREELEEAQVLLDRIEPVARKAGWTDFLAAALYHRSRLEQLRGEFQQATALVEEALLLYEAVRDEVGAARCVYSLAELSFWQGQHGRALAGFQRALEIYRTHQLSMEIAACKLGLSMVHAESGDPEEARALLEGATERFRALGDLQNVSICLNSLGELYRKQKEFARAEAMYLEAWKILESVGFKFDVAVRFNLGMTLLQQEEFARAEPVMQEVLENMQAAGRTGYVGLAQIAMLPSYAARADWAAWDASFEQALANLNQGGVVDQDVALLFEIAGNLAAKAGMVGRAQRAFESAAVQWETLGAAEKLQKVRKKLETLG